MYCSIYAESFMSVETYRPRSIWNYQQNVMQIESGNGCSLLEAVETDKSVGI